MPTQSTAYGSYSPAAIDPFPIEQVLAKIVGENNPAEAGNLLDLYQIQNQTSQGNYNYAQQQQHDFAKEQLAQQLKESYMKYGQEALKTPGGATLLGMQAPAALAGFDPAPFETRLAQAQAAKTLEAAGKGAYDAAQAGRDITDQGNAATGGLLGPYGSPLSTRNLLIKEQFANARHAAGAGGVKVSAQLAPDPAHPGEVLTSQVPPGMTLPQWREQLRLKGYGGGNQPIVPPPPLDGGGDSDVTPPPQTPPATPPPATPPPRGATNLTPAPAARVQSQGQGGGQAQQFANNWVENTVRVQNPTAYADIMANATNGNVALRQGPNGLYIVGKRGQY